MADYSIHWLGSSHVASLMQVVSATADNLVWYVVTIDSAETPFSPIQRDSITACLKAGGLGVRWDSWGCWVDASDVVRAKDLRGLIPPFSAVYLFAGPGKEIQERPFAITTEAFGDDFAMPTELELFMSRHGARGYFADGDGLLVAADAGFFPVYRQALEELPRGR